MGTEVIVPAYRALTIVGTALSRDDHGDMVHRTVSDTTSGEAVEVVFQLLSAGSKAV